MTGSTNLSPPHKDTPPRAIRSIASLDGRDVFLRDGLCPPEIGRGKQRDFLLEGQGGELLLC